MANVLQITFLNVIGRGPVQNNRQNITWANDNKVHWCTYTNILIPWLD